MTTTAATIGFQGTGQFLDDILHERFDDLVNSYNDLEFPQIVLTEMDNAGYDEMRCENLPVTAAPLEIKNPVSSTVRTLDAVIGERMVVLDRLTQLETPVLDLAEVRDFARAAADVQYLDRVIDRLDKRLGDLRQQYALAQQDRTNRRLAVLTVLSAVFLPLTLIAGIYGMNFTVMPELTYPMAYPIVIVVMILTGVGMVSWFRARGWFD